MLEIELAGAGDDATERLFLGFEFGGDRQRHLVRFQCASAHEDGVSTFAYLQEAMQIELGGEVRGVLGAGGGLAIGRDGKVDEDAGTGHVWNAEN